MVSPNAYPPAGPPAPVHISIGGQTRYLTYFPWDAHDDATVRADVTTVMSTWVWK